MLSVIVTIEYVKRMNDSNPKRFQGVEDLVKENEGLILDAFGVFWAGGKEGFYPGSLEVFERLKQRRIPIVILSNATQLSSKAAQKYGQAGLHEDFYLKLLTSGEVARSLFHDERALEEFGLQTPRKTYFVYNRAHPIYGSPHLELFKETPFQEVLDLKEADFIYVGIPHVKGQDQISSDIFKKEVEELVKSKKPLVVANPDRFVKEGEGGCVVRQGEIGSLYEKLGGRVFYIGKPGKLAFENAIKILESAGISKKRIWMVGDNPETDILGANQVGLRSLLITQTGVFCDLFENEQKSQKDLSFESFIGSLPKKYMPTCAVKRFAPLQKVSKAKEIT